MPLASMSKVTSILGTPRGAAGIPSRWNLPRVRLAAAISRSPCRTWTSTLVWPSAAVVKISLFRTGIVVFLSMRFVLTPPRPVFRRVDPLVLPEFPHDPLDDPLVDVVAAQVRVPVGRLHLDDVVSHLKDRDVEGAPSEVEDRDQLVLLLVEAVRERRGRRLVVSPGHTRP